MASNSSDTGGTADIMAMSCSVSQHPGAMVDKMQTLIAAIQESVASLAHPAEVVSNTAADTVTTSTLTWLADLQLNISALQSLTKKLVKSGALGEFVLFPKLPIELRKIIWELTVSEPRILEVANGGRNGVRTSHKLPVPLHVCQESRAITRQKYPIIMGIVPPRYEHKGKSYAYFNPETDIIYIPYSSLGRSPGTFFLVSRAADYSWTPEALKNITHLAIDARVWALYSDADEISFRLFPALKKVTLVVHDDAECKEEWCIKYTREIAFVDYVGPKSTSVIDLEIEVGCELLRQKQSKDAPVGSEVVPKIEIKYLARGGKRCCGK